MIALVVALVVQEGIAAKYAGDEGIEKDPRVLFVEDFETGDLKEIEYLTLAILQDRGTMIVGDIQRILGVLPAQMSRVIRSLEARQWPLIGCRINPDDKRKIDVGLTEAGEKALLEYQGVHVRRIAELLHDMTEEDQESLVHLLEKVRTLLERPAAN